MYCTRMITIITLVFVITFLLGCRSKDFISRGEIEAYPQYPIYMVITNDGQVFEFEPHAVLEDSTIKGTLKDGTHVEIAIRRVNMVYAKKFDQSRSGAAFVFGAGTTALLAVLAVVGAAAGM
ncbi:MAG: hypothetical protein WBE28_08495 [bacterium]